MPGDGFHAVLHGPVLPNVARADYLDMIDRRCAHIHYKSEADWRDLLANAGMKVVAAVPYLSGPETRLWESCSRYTGGLLYSLFGRRHQPIQIQRHLGIRRSGARMPLPMARLVSRILQAPLDVSPVPPFGCLLIDAEKD